MRFAEFVRKQYQNVAASAAVSNTTTETAFDKSRTFVASTFKAGDSLRVKVHVKATATNSTDTLTVRLKLGSTTIATTGAVDVANSDVAIIDFEIVFRTVGASGTLIAFGQVSEGVPGTSTMKATDLAETAVDTTAALSLTVTAQWSAQSASDSCRLENLIVQHMTAPVG